MPAKRAATGGTSQAKKKSRPSGDKIDEAEAAKRVRASMAPMYRKKRYGDSVSTSANLEEEYHKSFLHLQDGYKFVCICKAPFPTDDDDEEEEEDEEDERNEENQAPKAAHTEKTKKRVKCDGGKTCICNKPAADYPDHL